jgi:hypothetical protein
MPPRPNPPPHRVAHCSIAHGDGFALVGVDPSCLSQLASQDSDGHPSQYTYLTRCISLL